MGKRMMTVVERQAAMERAEADRRAFERGHPFIDFKTYPETMTFVQHVRQDLPLALDTVDLMETALALTTKAMRHFRDCLNCHHSLTPCIVGLRLEAEAEQAADAVDVH